MNGVFSMDNGLATDTVYVFKGTGNVAMNASGDKSGQCREIEINKTVGAATQVTLPPSPAVGEYVTVKDGKGDAATNNITVIGASSATIDGQSSYVIQANYGAVMLRWNGTEWKVLAERVAGGSNSPTFNNLTLTGAFNDSAAAGLTAAGSNQAGALQLTADDNYVATVAAATGVALPAATAGRCVTVINGGANTLNVYPKGASDVINALAATIPTPLPAGQLAVFGCAKAGQWNTLVITPRQVQTAINTVGAGTLTAAGIVGGYILRGGAQSGSAFTDTTDTAANIINALHGATVGQSWALTVQNNTNAPQTVSGGTGVTVSGVTIIPANMWAEYLVTFSAAGAVTMVGVGMGANGQLPATQYTSISAGNGTLAAGNMEGAADVTLASSGATAMTTRTAAQIIANIPNAQTGMSYRLRVYNTNAGTLTLTGGTGVTITGTATIATNVWRDYYVTITGASTITMQNLGSGTAN